MGGKNGKGEAKEREKGREESKGKEKEGRDEKEMGKYNIVFWTVAELNNKDKDFWRALGKWDIVILVEA